MYDSFVINIDTNLEQKRLLCRETICSLNIRQQSNKKSNEETLSPNLLSLKISEDLYLIMS